MFPVKGNSIVLLCFEEESQEFYIVKVLKINTGLDDDDIGGVDDSSEVTHLGEVEHVREFDQMYNSNVLTYDIAEKINGGKEAIIISLYRGVHLLDYKVKVLTKVHIAVVLQIIFELIGALKSVHEKGIIHRDIKPENIFVLETFDEVNIPLLTLTLGDFGIATKKEELNNFSNIEENVEELESEESDYESSCESDNYTKEGSEGYTAPECFDGILNQTNDIWSLASAILTFLFPNRNTKQDRKEKVLQVVNSVDQLFGALPLDFEDDPEAWKGIAELLKGMLNNNPMERLTIRGVLDFMCGGKPNLKFLTLPQNYEYLREEWMNNKSTALLCASVSIPVLRPSKQRPNVSDVLTQDKQIAALVIKKCGLGFENVHESLKGDKDLIYLSVDRSSTSLRYAAKYLKSDREFVLEIVKKNGYCLDHVHDSLKKDYEIVMAAVKKFGSSLSYADEELRKDRNIVLEAVKNDGLALEFACDILKKDREIVLAAVTQVEDALQYADVTLQNDKEMLEQAAKTKEFNVEEDEPITISKPKIQRELCIYDLPNAHPTLRKDKLFMLQANSKVRTALKYADESLKRDTDFILQAIQDNYNAFEFVEDSFKCDRQFVIKAVRRNGYALKFAHDELKKDKIVVLNAVYQRGSGLEYADKTLQQDRDVVLTAVRRRGNSLEYADESLKNDKEIVMEAVRNYTCSFCYASEALKKDMQFVKELMMIDRKVLDFADEELVKVLNQ